MYTMESLCGTWKMMYLPLPRTIHFERMLDLCLWLENMKIIKKDINSVLAENYRFSSLNWIKRELVLSITVMFRDSQPSIREANGS